MEKDKNPFEYRVIPKNNWELVWWAVMDREHVKTYAAYLKFTRWQGQLMFLKIFFLYLVPFTIGLTALLWLAGITLIAVTDLPNLISAYWWGEGFFESWLQKTTLSNKWMYLFQEQLFDLVGGLVGSLGIFSIRTLIRDSENSWEGDLVLGLVFGLALGLAGGLGGSLVAGWEGGLMFGLVFGLVFGLASALMFPLSVSLLSSILVGGIGGGWVSALAGALGFILPYLAHLILAHSPPSLTHNPYLRWGTLDLSLFLEQKLIRLCQLQPDTGLHFADFLWQYRPKQHNLATLLAHASTAKRWEHAAIDLDETRLRFPEYDQKNFQVPTRWQEQLDEAKKSLIAAETTHLISTRVTLFHDFLTALEGLHKSTQQLPLKTWRDKISMTRRINWYTYYAQATAAWLQVAREKYAELQALAALTEPIATNRYQTGGALSPAYNQAVFMSRDDLKNQLSALLYTTQNFSVFFLQGQRRVGKTSLLKFLPHILGRRFELVYLDLQGSIRSVPDFLQKWQRAFAAHFELQEVPPLPQADTWAATFEALHPLFSATAQARDVKIILALDEYEELHTHLAKDPEQGAAFLGAIRHFSQHQAQVSLMFVGLRFFSELQAPNWNEYFPQSVPIQVGYLDRQRTFQLLEVSTLDFEDGTQERIYELTQGHPSLIQKIGYELVQIANREGRRLLTHADVDAALRTMIYIQDNGVTDIFWSQNCELSIDKAIVCAIVEGQPLPPQSRQRLRRLLEYGFIEEQGEGYRMRVPIFEEWVRRFGLE